MTKPTLRRKPDGIYTDNLEEYLESWDCMITAIENKINVKVLSCNPNFIIKNNTDNCTCNLPFWLAEKIISL